MAAYIALIRKDPESSFGVEFPDFPGCISAGDTLSEAAQGAYGALALHVRGMLDDGEPIPEPSTLEDLMSNVPIDELADTVPLLVPVTLERRGRAVRINITVEENLLQDVDRTAGELGVSRSAFLADAARTAIKGGKTSRHPH